MSFLQPLILIGLPLALIPIIIHLLNRLRYRSVSWGAIMFVLKASRSSTSMARVRQWLVLLLRILAVAFLVVAVARPLLGGWLGWQLAGSPDTVIILLDRSATMGTNYQGEKNCLTQGVELLVKTGLKVSADSRIILIDSVEMTPKQIPNWQVLNEISDTKVTQTAADVPSMFRKALDYLLKNGTGVTEVWCLSDLQRSNWQPNNTEWSELEAKFKTLNQPVTFKILSVKSGKTGNCSISLIDTLNYKTVENKRIFELVFSVIADNQTGGSEVPVVIVNNGAKQQANIKLSGESSRIRFRVPTPEKNKINYGYITLPPDSNLQDNIFYFAYGGLPEGKVVLYSKNPFLRDLFSAAVAPESSPDAITFFDDISNLDKVALGETSLLIWNGDYPSGQLGNRLKSYLENGGVALFFPPPEGEPVEEQLKNRWGKTVNFPADKPEKVVEWDHAAGPLSDTASGSPLPVDSLRLYKRRTLSGALADASAVCSDGRPLLYNMFFSKKGKLYFCTTLPLADWSNLGEGVVLVPMLQRMLREGYQRFSRISYLTCGETALDKENKSQPLARFSDIEKTADSDPQFQTGIFLNDQKYVVLNRPQIEDVRGEMVDDDVKALFKDRRIYLFNESTENDAALQAEIWRWFLIAMFIFLIAESFLLTPGKELSNMEQA